MKNNFLEVKKIWRLIMNDKKSLEELVKQMMMEPNPNPRDQCFKDIVNTYPEAVHKAFDFPGQYKEKLGLEILTADNRQLKMDCAQLIEPKGDITCKSTINVEHQTYPIKNKIDAIYDYKIGLIHKNNIPSTSIVMTNLDLGGDDILCESHDQKFRLRVNRVTIEKISKRLKILKYKIKNNQELSLEELMYFPYIAIFVDEKHSKEIMGELTKLFPQINQINPSIELDIHQHLKNMIKFHFKDNKTKCKEMLTMLSETLYSNDYEGLTYKERTQLQIKGMNKELQQKNQQIEQKDQQIEQKNQQIEQLLKENKELKKSNKMK